MQKRIAIHNLEEQTKTNEDPLVKEEMRKRDLLSIAELKSHITRESLLSMILNANRRGCNCRNIIMKFLYPTAEETDLFRLKDENNESLKDHIESFLDPVSIRVTCIFDAEHLRLTLRWGDALTRPDADFEMHPVEFTDFIHIIWLFIMLSPILLFGYISSGIFIKTFSLILFGTAMLKGCRLFLTSEFKKQMSNYILKSCNLPIKE